MKLCPTKNVLSNVLGPTNWSCRWQGLTVKKTLDLISILGKYLCVNEEQFFLFTLSFNSPQFLKKLQIIFCNKWTVIKMRGTTFFQGRCVLPIFRAKLELMIVCLFVKATASQSKIRKLRPPEILKRYLREDKSLYY